MAARDYRLTIVVIGPKNAGKTVFLSALANSPGVGSGDPATVKAVKLHWESLARGENPPATAATLTNMLFSFNGRAADGEYNIDLRLPDYDGHFAEILSEYESGAREIGQLRELVRQADGFVVLMPADSRDAAVMEKLRVEIGAFIDAARSEFGAKITRPLVIAVNKWDNSPSFKSAGEDEAARAFIESIGIYRDIYRKLQSHFADIVILPISAYGHAAEEGKPGAEGLAPYRVEEPILAIIEKCFASLQSEARQLESEGNWLALASLLARTRALWQRRPDAVHAALFEKSLAHCGRKLAERLSKAGNAADYDRIWNESPERQFQEDFAPGERAAIEDARRKSLLATSRALADRLAKTGNRAEYENILHNSPEGKYFADFGSEQRSDILKMAKRHERAEKRSKGRRRTGLGIAALFLLGVAFCAWWYADFSRRFAEAMNPALGPGAQWHELAGFITRYEANPVAARLFAAKIAQASKQRAALVEGVAADIEARAEAAAKDGDACSRAALASRLLEEANTPGLNAPRGLINKIDVMHEQGSRLCQAATLIENAKTPAELESAEKLLVRLPATAEAASLRERLGARLEALTQAHAASPEGARLAALREEFSRIGSGGNLEEAENFISLHSDDTSDEARSLAGKLAEGMGNRLYRALVALVRSMKTFGDDELGQLRDMAARTRRYPLEAAHRKTFSDELQKIAESHDRELIDAIPQKADSRAGLEDAEKKLKEAAAFPASLKLGDNLFRYRRPDDLEYALAARAQALAPYRKMLTEGLEVRNLEVAAEAENSLNLHGRRLGSAFTKNNELTIAFPGDMGEISWRSAPLADHEDGKIYSLNFGPLLVKTANGEASLREENFGGADLGCASPFSIDEADLFTLQGAGVLRKPLSGTCRGLSLIFHAQGSQ